MTSGPQDPQDPQHGRQEGEPPDEQQSPYGQQPPYGQSPYGQSPYGQAQYGQPQYGQPQYGQPPYGQPQYGQPQYGQPPYGQSPYGQPQYGQSPYGQPGWSPYPSAPGYGQPAVSSEPTPRPQTVTAGLAAFVAQAVVSLVATAIGFADLDSLVEQAAADAGVSGPDFSGVGRTVAIVGLVFSLLGAVFYLGMAWAAAKGHNWARIVLWVFGGLGLLFGLLGLITSSGVLAVLGVLQLLLLAAGVVLLALRPSNEWYRAESRRRQGWAG